MTTPITTQQQAAVPALRDWCCGTPITAPHTAGCAYEPAQLAAPEPPPTPSEVSAAAQTRVYGFRKRDEADLELPSGSVVRFRKLMKSDVLRLNLVEVLDGFTPELLADISSGDATVSEEAALKALTDPERNGKIFGPVDRVVAAAVIIPTVVLDGPTTDTQVNVDEVDLEDKLAIFTAAIGEQLDALKSVRVESSTVV